MNVHAVQCMHMLNMIDVRYLGTGLLLERVCYINIVWVGAGVCVAQ